MIVSILENAQPQHSKIWDIYAVILPEKSIGTGSPSGLVVHRGLVWSERCASAVGSDCRLETMSAQSLSVSMISEPRKVGNQRVDAQRDNASCSLVNTSWRFCRVMLAFFYFLFLFYFILFILESIGASSMLDFTC